MMSRLFRTAIVGLGRSDVMILRDAVQTASGVHQFEWVNADEENIDLLVVNGFFINSSGIQKIIQQQAMPCLIVDHQAKTPSVDDDGLHLPLQETSSLKTWLNTFVFNQVKQQSAPPPVAQQRVQAPPVQSHRAEQSTPITPKSNGQATSAKHQFPGASLNETIAKLVEMRLGIWEIADQERVLAIADCSHQLIWYDQNQQHKNQQLHLPLKLNKIYQVPQQHKPTDLRQWLWQLAWANENENSFIHKTVPVQLSAWPQPFDAIPHQSLLAACASLRANARSAESLSTQLNMSLLDAQRLITSLLAVNFVKEVKVQTAKTHAPVLESQHVEQEDTSFFKGFLSKLRNKLGL
jgi:hypothetical protein